MALASLPLSYGSRQAALATRPTALLCLHSEDPLVHHLGFSDFTFYLVFQIRSHLDDASISQLPPIGPNAGKCTRSATMLPT